MEIKKQSLTAICKNFGFYQRNRSIFEDFFLKGRYLEENIYSSNAVRDLPIPIAVMHSGRFRIKENKYAFLNVLCHAENKFLMQVRNNAEH